MEKHTYYIAAENPAYGVEGQREYTGTQRGALVMAGKISKRAGHNWTAVIKLKEVAQ